MENMVPYIVTDIIEINKKKRKICINYDTTFALYCGELRRYGIKKDTVIDNEIFDEIINVVLMKRAKIRAMNLLKSRDMTEFTLAMKLRDSYYPEHIINNAVDYVKGYGYIDDRRYANNYIMFRCKSKSRMQIRNSLIQKGIRKDLADELCREYYEDNDDEEKKLIEKLILKKVKDPGIMSFEERNKIFAQLFRKGFQIDSINRVIDEIVEKFK